MHDARRGEFIARAAGRSNARIAQVHRPYEGCRGRRRGLPRSWHGEANVDRYSGAPAARASGRAAKRVRGARAKVRARRSPQTLEGQKPKGASSRRRPKPTPAVRDSGEGRSPETAACRAGPLLRGGSNGGRNGTWVPPGGNAPETSREEKAPKGESQERCRHEIRPARARRAETAERVTKP
jgi:hypothetical protein